MVLSKGLVQMNSYIPVKFNPFRNIVVIVYEAAADISVNSLD